MVSEMQKPVVMFLTPSLEIGGAEMMLDLILSHLDELTFRPVICCTYSPGLIGEKLASRGITIYSSIASHRFDISIVLRLMSIAKRENVKLIYELASSNNTLLYGLLASRIAGIGFVNALHNARTYSRTTMVLRRTCMQLSAMVIALTQRHKLFIMEYYRVKEKNIHIIPNSVDFRRFETDVDKSLNRARLNLPSDKPVIGMVATLRPLKAHEIFLQAAQRTLKSVPDAHFLIVGDGSERGNLEKYASELGIEASIHFLGERTDIPEILACIDLFVLSSRQETFPISVLEAMAASKPVVATNVGFLDELVLHGETGFLVPPDDFDHLANVMQILLTEPALARRMGATGRKRVEAHFSVGKTLAAFEKVVFACIDSGR